jgi:hypothetical protein
MKAHVQKNLGLVLLVGAPVAAIALWLFGVQLASAHFETLSGKPATGWTEGWVGHISFHWPSFVLGVAALLGVWLLARAKHEKPRA